MESVAEFNELYTTRFPPACLEEQQRPRLNALTWCGVGRRGRVLECGMDREPRPAIGRGIEGLYQQRLIGPHLREVIPAVLIVPLHLLDLPDPIFRVTLHGDQIVIIDTAGIAKRQRCGFDRLSVRGSPDVHDRETPGQQILGLLYQKQVPHPLGGGCVRIVIVDHTGGFADDLGFAHGFRICTTRVVENVHTDSAGHRAKHLRHFGLVDGRNLLIVKEIGNAGGLVDQGKALPVDVERFFGIAAIMDGDNMVFIHPGPFGIVLPCFGRDIDQSFLVSVGDIFDSRLHGRILVFGHSVSLSGLAPNYIDVRGIQASSRYTPVRYPQKRLVVSTSMTIWPNTVVNIPRMLPVFLIPVLALLLTVPAAAQDVPQDAVAEKKARTLIVGRVSGNPRKHASRLLALGEHIVASHSAFDHVEVILKPNPDDMVAAAQSGEIDIVSETLFTALKIEATGQMDMALLEWKENVPSYHSVLLVRADSPFQTLQDLRGARIAFEDPGSTSGFFLPYVEIMEAGLNMVPDGSGQAKPQHVGYLFGGAEINVVGSLIRGRVDAAAISNLDMDDDEVVTGRFGKELRVLHETRPVPRSVMLLRSSLPEPVRDELKAILMDLHQSDMGRSVLRKYFKIKQFEIMEADVRSEFDWVRNAFNTHHNP